mgnify:CR=1 FL=1
MDNFIIKIIVDDNINRTEEQIYEKILNYDVNTGHIFSSSKAITFVEEIEAVVRSYLINKKIKSEKANESLNVDTVDGINSG